MLRAYDRSLVFDYSGLDYFDGIIFDDIYELKAFWNTVCGGKFRLIYKPPHRDFELLREEIDTLAGWALLCGNMAFLIEELNVVFDGRKFPSKINECIFAGRKPGVEFITVSQRPKGFGQDIQSQAAEFHVFNTHHDSDLQYFKTEMSKDALAAIESLNQYHYLKWNNDTQIMEVCKDGFITPNMG